MIDLDIPDPTNVEIVADWIELSVAWEQEPVSKAAIGHKIEMASGDEPSDAFLSNVWDLLDYRMLLYGEHPPFIVNGQEVTPNLIWEECPEYVMCLILSLTGNPVNPTPTGKLFERVSREAVKQYINGEAIIFGHPTQYTINQICGLTNEGFKRELPANYNDRGVDVIAWKPFGDQRGNQVIILMQCAGGHNWVLKTGDVATRAWREKYITFGCTPLKGFSTAVVISNSEVFEEISLEADLLFDRTRIYRNIVDRPLEGTLSNEVKVWCDTRIAEILN